MEIPPEFRASGWVSLRSSSQQQSQTIKEMCPGPSSETLGIHCAKFFPQRSLMGTSCLQLGCHHEIILAPLQGYQVPSSLVQLQTPFGEVSQALKGELSCVSWAHKSIVGNFHWLPSFQNLDKTLLIIKSFVPNCW